MNAPAPAAATAAPLQTSAIPLDHIVPSDNPIQVMRRGRFDKVALQELAASMAAVGQIQAIVVRPAAHVKDRFELVAGERRWLAARINKAATIDAVVRRLTDDQVIELQLVENLQREGLHELEEAEGYDQLRRLRVPLTVEQIAAKVGRSIEYVYARLKLLALDPDARREFYAGNLDASRALYVARIANPKLRARALELATRKEWNGNFAMSVRQLREQLTGKDFSISLRAAPFALDDKSFFELVQVEKTKDPKIQNGQSRPLPDCNSCPNRTGNCLDLFNQGDDPLVCMEPACFQIKVAQHSERLRHEAAKANATIVKGDAAKKILPRKGETNGYVDLDDICSEDTLQEKAPAKQDYKSEAAFDKAMEAYQERDEAHQQRSFRQLLDGERVNVVLVEDPRTKQVRSMVSFKEAKEAAAKKGVKLQAYLHSYKTPTRTPAAKQDPEAAAKLAEQQRLEEERREQELAFRSALLQACFDKWSGPLKQQDMAAIAIELLDRNWQAREAMKPLYQGKYPQPGQMKESELPRLIVATLVAHCVRAAHFSPKELLALAARLKIDPKKVRRNLETKASPAPAKKAKKS